MKKWIAMLTLGIMLFSMSFPAAAADATVQLDGKDTQISFSNTYYAEECSKAAEAGYVIDALGTDFTKTITRSQFCKLVVHMLEVKSGAALEPAENPFQDTDDPDILKAYGAGVTNGTTATTFSPDALLNRQQLAAMLDRALGVLGVTAASADMSAYQDWDKVGDFAKAAVAKLNTLEVMKGTSDTTLSPTSPCRIEMAVLLVARAAAAEFQVTAQYFRASQLQTLDKENVAGGTGTLYGRFSSTRDQAETAQAIKEIGFMRLEPGSSIGLHTHGVNEDTYIILSGTGLFSDGVTESTVTAGDITIARPGQGHALSNTGTEPLLFVDVIAQNDAYQESSGKMTTGQYFKSDELITLDKEDVAGGTGTLYGRFSFTRDQATADQAIKEIGFMRLEPGSSIGLHAHGANEDTYIILSGTGVFSDGVVSFDVAEGDITIARAGQSHALRNTGTEPLLFLDIIAQNDGAVK